MIPNSRVRLIRECPVCDFNTEDHDIDEINHMASVHCIVIPAIITEAFSSPEEQCIDTAEYRVDSADEGSLTNYSDYCEKHMLVDDAIVMFWHEVDVKTGSL